MAGRYEIYDASLLEAFFRKRHTRCPTGFVGDGTGSARRCWSGGRLVLALFLTGPCGWCQLADFFVRGVGEALEDVREVGVWVDAPSAIIVGMGCGCLLWMARRYV